jgi:tripartite-type tricarboxylate transporter receptor subunit TctC
LTEFFNVRRQQLGAGMKETDRISQERRRVIQTLAAASLSFASPLVPRAQTRFPSRPVRLVVGNAPGSLDDILARLIGPKLSDAMGQPMIVENRLGAAAALAADHVAKSPADGYSLLLCADSVMTFNPFVYSKLPYDPVRDFQPVAMIGKASMMLAVSPALNVKTLAEFFQLAKAKPLSINYGSAGAGSTLHIVMELIANRMGIELTHVPYKGPALAMQALLAGEVSAMIVGMAVGLPQVRAGRVVPLATSGPLGKETFPNLPEFKESHPDLDVSTWFGLFAPAAVPAPVISTLNAEVNKSLGLPDVRSRLSEFGIVPIPAAAVELENAARLDRQRYGALIRGLRLRND